MTLLEQLRKDNPPHAEYVQKMIDEINKQPQEWRAAYAEAQVVRGIVRRDDLEHQILVEVFGPATAADREAAIQAYG